MAENSAYFDSIVASRAMLLEDEEALEGCTTISLETQADMSEQDILSYIETHFDSFLKTLRFLNKEDQELLLSYYLLSKTQNTLAVIHKSTQTVCSFKIRMAVKTLGTFIMMGEPSVEMMHEILEKAQLEDSLKREGLAGVNLSQVIDEYSKCRSFQRIAEVHKLHRPDIRRAMSRASKKLLDSRGREHALGAYIYSLIDKANPSGQGYSKRKIAKQCHLVKTDPPILGQFRVKVQDPDFEHMFVSRANR